MINAVEHAFKLSSSINRELCEILYFRRAGPTRVAALENRVKELQEAIEDIKRRMIRER